MLAPCGRHRPPQNPIVESIQPFRDVHVRDRVIEQHIQVLCKNADNIIRETITMGKDGEDLLCGYERSNGERSRHP
jgi:hypothetical protein